MNSTEIKACPFCGSDEISVGSRSDHPDESQAWVACHKCGASGPVAETESKAICHWNARAGDLQPITSETVGIEGVGISDLLAGGGAKWVSEGTQPLWACQGWRLFRRNKTSGKARGGIFASNLGEYAAKTIANDANAGNSCFTYKVVSTMGEIFHLEKPANDRTEPRSDL